MTALTAVKLSVAQFEFSRVFSVHAVETHLTYVLPYVLQVHATALQA
jgi:hypothetical protein